MSCDYYTYQTRSINDSDTVGLFTQVKRYRGYFNHQIGQIDKNLNFIANPMDTLGFAIYVPTENLSYTYAPNNYYKYYNIFMFSFTHVLPRIIHRCSEIEYWLQEEEFMYNGYKKHRMNVRADVIGGTGFVQDINGRSKLLNRLLSPWIY